MLWSLVPLDFDPATDPPPRVLYPREVMAHALARHALPAEGSWRAMPYAVRFDADRQAVFPDDRAALPDRPHWSVTAAADPHTGLVLLFGDLPPELPTKIGGPAD